VPTDLVADTHAALSAYEKLRVLEIALTDVLRHRSLNTTLIYAKLDSRKLAEVALPWPGAGSAA
jgi:hypothetical protein